MKRSVLQKILETADGVKPTSKNPVGFKVADGVELVVHFGDTEPAIAFGKVQALRLGEDLLELESTKNETLYTDYDKLCALVFRKSEKNSSQRTGFA